MREISVVIPTHNNRAGLERSLRALMAQDFPLKRCEIVVLDDGSDDGTDAIVAAGGFDESFPGYGWEDIELGLRLHARGVRFIYDPHALGDHDDVETLERTREKLRQAGEGAVYFWSKHARRVGLGLFLEIHPALLPLKWLVSRTRAVGRLVRRVLPWAGGPR